MTLKMNIQVTTSMHDLCRCHKLLHIIFCLVIAIMHALQSDLENLRRLRVSDGLVRVCFII